MKKDISIRNINMKEKVKFNNKKQTGITLIALVITIIVLLILAGVSIATLTGENGILNRASTAKEKMGIAEIIERAQTDILEKQAENNSKDITQKQLRTVLDKYFNEVPDPLPDDISNLELTAKDEYGKHKIKISDIWNGTTLDSVTKGVSIGEIFDSTGEQEGKLHIGDFINYSAGDWTDGKMTQLIEAGLKFNNSTDVPSGENQFGGFTSQSSRNKSASPTKAAYDYVQEIKSDGTKQAVEGWRLFDVNEGEITLISAGCPEDYCNPSGMRSGLLTEFYLTGSQHSRNMLGGNAPSVSLIRDWSMYSNEAMGAIESKVLTEPILNEWYSKYVKANANVRDETTFRAIYGSKFESLIDNYSSYFLAYPYSNSDQTMMVFSSYERVTTTYSSAGGIRVLVTLSPKVKLSETSTETKTIQDPRNSENSWTYNVWNLQ